jgi:2-oxoglutarate ferredoxin oxidoreductase subunit delta
MSEKKPKVKTYPERCKGCGLCVMYCPKKILELSEELNAKGYHPVKVKNPDECIGCGSCYLMCPECAIEVTVEEKKEAKK